MPGSVTGRMLDMGYYKLPLGIASAVLVICAFLVAECKEYWQFLLCQGVGMGVGFPLAANTCGYLHALPARLWFYIPAVAWIDVPMV